MEALSESNISGLMENDFDFSNRQWSAANKSSLESKRTIFCLFNKKILKIDDPSIELIPLYQSSKLDHIEKQIEEAEDYFRSGSYFEEEDCRLIQQEAFQKAIDFVRRYSRYILNKYSQIIVSPYIDVLKDGSISVDWENQKAKFLIIFKNNSKLAYFYGEKDDKIPFKGAVETNDTIEESLAIWMKNYLA